jgi:hypothetical protein
VFALVLLETTTSVVKAKLSTGCGRINRSSENEITVEMLEEIDDNFPKRLKACVEAKGDHFE